MTKPSLATTAAILISLQLLALPQNGFASPCVTPPSGLVSWWPGDGSAIDLGSGNNGVLSNGATFAAGEVNQTFSFATNHSAVVVGNPPNLQLQTFTIEAWIQRATTNVVTTDPGYNGVIFSYGSNGYGIYLSSGDNSLGLSKIGYDNTKGTGAAPIADTNWHHVAVTKSGSTVVFYIDGVGYPAPAYSSTFTFTTPAAIGARADNLNTVNNDSFYGAIDELAIYNRALTAAEIQSIYAEGSGGKCKPTLLVSPSTGFDSSGEAGGPFSPSSQMYTLSNPGGAALNWSANVSNNWLVLSPTTGPLAAGASTNVIATITGTATNFGGGLYSNQVGFVNLTNDRGSTNRVATLLVRDGIPDWWRRQYFGHADPNPNDLSRAQDDPDGDGCNNLCEFLAGTNPTNSAAYLHVIGIVETGNDINVTYLGANGDTTWTPGVQSRTNILEYSTGNPADGSYSDNFLSAVQTNILSGGSGLGTNVMVTDVGGATNTPSRYYRVRVLVP
jgi:hypothetical protein